MIAVNSDVSFAKPYPGVAWRRLGTRSVDYQERTLDAQPSDRRMSEHVQMELPPGDRFAIVRVDVRGGLTVVAVMQSADFRHRHDPTGGLTTQGGDSEHPSLTGRGESRQL